MIFIVFQSVLFHDGKTRPRFPQVILNSVLFKGLIWQKRVPNSQKALHDCSYAGPRSDKHPKSPALSRRLSSTPQYQVTQEIWLSFVPRRLIWRCLKTFLGPFLACLPCLKRESDLSPTHLAKWGPHLYLQLDSQPQGWPAAGISPRLEAASEGEHLPPSPRQPSLPQDRHAAFCLRGSSRQGRPCHRRQAVPDTRRRNIQLSGSRPACVAAFPSQPTWEDPFSPGNFTCSILAGIRAQARHARNKQKPR